VVPQHDAPGQAADEVPAPVSLTERPRPELLGGEVPREFQRGTASWYGPRFNGRRTASGERFDMREFTAAHRTLPFGTLVRVHSLVNGRDVDVRITDRGPYAGNRIIDLSRAAAEELGMLGLGFKEVVLMVPESTSEVAVAPPSPPPRKPVRKPRRPSPAVSR
jgi:rare lipoprotein A